jgi:hypothetical protein
MLKIPIIEVILSIVSAWWAIVLFNSPDLFERMPTTYSFFSSIANEIQWAVLFFTAALVKIFGILLKRELIRKIGLFMSAVIYGLIAAAYFIGTGWFSIGFGTFAAISVMAFWGIREVKMRNG